MTKLPEPQFSSWHSPTGVCNAFPWPPRIPEDEYWKAKGYHGEPLYTADQLRQYARDVLEEAAVKLEFVADGYGIRDKGLTPEVYARMAQTTRENADAIRAMKGEI